MDAKKLDSRTVEERLAKLEKQNRRLKVAGAVSLVLVAALVLVSATTPKITDHSTSNFKFRSVQVRELIVVGAKGEKRGMLGVVEDVPGLLLYDAKGTRCAGLVLNEDGPMLYLSDAKGKMRAALGVFNNCPKLVLSDEKGTLRAGLSLSEAGGVLHLFDEKGDVIWQAPPPDDAPEEAEADEE